MKKTFSIALLAFLLLSACSSVPAKQASVGSAKQPTVQQNAASGNEVAAEVRTSRFGENMKCNVLKATGAQQECELRINDMIGSMLEAEITSSYDVDRCKELPTDIATQCLERLGATGVKGPVTAEEITLFNEITRGKMNENPENPKLIYESTRCDELKASGYKEYCEKYIAERMDQDKLGDIMRSEDKARCDELSTQSMKNQCKRFFGEEVVEEVPVTTPAVTTPAPVTEVPANQ